MIFFGYSPRGSLGITSLISMGFISFFLAQFFIKFTNGYWGTSYFIIEAIFSGLTFGLFLENLLGHRFGQKLFILAPLLLLTSICVVLFYPHQELDFIYFLYLLLISLYYAFFSQKLAGQFNYYPALKLFSFFLIGGALATAMLLPLNTFEVQLYFWPLILLPFYLLLSNSQFGILKKLAVCLYLTVAFFLIYQKDNPKQMQVLEINDNSEKNHKNIYWSAYKRWNKEAKRLWQQIYFNQDLSLKDTSYNILYLGHNYKINESITSFDIDIVEKDWSPFRSKSIVNGKNIKWIMDDPWNYLQHTEKNYDYIIFPPIFEKHNQEKYSPEYLYTIENFGKSIQMLRVGGHSIIQIYGDSDRLVEKLESIAHFLSPEIGIIKTIPLKNITQLDFIRPKKIKTSLPLHFKEGEISFPHIDWPFFNLDNPGLSNIQLKHLFHFCLALLFVFMVSRLGSHTALYEGATFTLLGLVITLLEIKCFIEFIILFGNTWSVQVYVLFSMIIALILATWIGSFLPKIEYLSSFGLILILTCLLNFTFPPSALLTITYPFLRLIMGALICFAPIFMTQILFSAQWKDQKGAENSLSWKLFGMSMGPVFAHYFSIQFGYNNLSLVTAGIFVVITIIAVLSKYLLQSGRMAYN